MLVGTLDPADLATFSFPTPLRLDDTFIVQATWEIAGTPGVSLLPPALHPTLPTLVSVVAVCGHAQVRLSCRHGARARGLVVATTADVEFDGHRLSIGSGVEIIVTPPSRELGPGDVQYVTSLWPVPIEGRGLRLVQQELDVDVHFVSRHAASVERWDPAWPTPATVVGLSVARGAVELPAPRFMARTDVLAFEGSETV